MYTGGNRPIVVKIGSESLADFVNSQKVNRLIMDIHYLMKEYNEKIILVSSGSVAHGRILRPDIDDKQVLSALGQPYLIAEYRKKFAEYKRKKDEYHIDIAQILVTHADIEDDYSKRKTFVETIGAIFDVGNILPIINENDPLSTEEMQHLGRGADNDKNALLIAKLFNAKLLAIVTNTDGVLDESNARINSITSSKITPEYIGYICDKKSQGGTGGMSSKLNVAKQAGEAGIPAYIFDGKNSTLLEYINLAKEGTLDKLAGGTIIIP